MAEISLSVDVDLSPEDAWAAVTDWDRQGEWMVLTRVHGTHLDGRAPGGQLEAFTGVGRLGFLDPMVVTTWQPPHRCVVRHTGRVVRGSAAFEIEALPDGRSRFVWSEWLVLPLGVLGEIGFRLLRPLFVAPLRRSLANFAHWAPSRG